MYHGYVPPTHTPYLWVGKCRINMLQVTVVEDCSDASGPRVRLFHAVPVFCGLENPLRLEGTDALLALEVSADLVGDPERYSLRRAG